jgi:DoxX-like family
VSTAVASSRGALWTGRALSGFVILFLLFDSALKLANMTVVADTMRQLGYPTNLAQGLGVLILVCTLLYAIPRTAPLGAILLTGLLGGAIATHLRVGSPIFSHLLFGLYLGLILWVGLFLRDERLRALIPLRRRHSHPETRTRDSANSSAVTS